MKWLAKKTDRKIVFTALKGSQNYKLDEYTETHQSDIDLVAFVMPTMEDLLRGNRVSKVVHYDEITSETKDDKIEIKDIRYLLDYVYKPNPNWLELLYTRYYEAAEGYETFVEHLRLMADEISYIDRGKMLNSVRGIAHTAAKKHDKKNLVVLYRMLYFVDSIVKGYEMAEALVPNSFQQKLLIDIRNGRRDFKEEDFDDLLKSIDTIVDNYRGEQRSEETVKKLESLVFNLIIQDLRA